MGGGISKLKGTMLPERKIKKSRPFGKNPDYNVKKGIGGCRRREKKELRTGSRSDAV